MLRREDGFTLIEMMMVVIIIAILAAVAAPKFIGARREAQISACSSNIANINTQWEFQHLQYPDWDAEEDEGYVPLGDGTTAGDDPDGTRGSLLGSSATPSDYFPDGPPSCPVGAGTAYADADDNQRVDPHNH